jgi:hypothetical protein
MILKSPTHGTRVDTLRELLRMRATSCSSAIRFESVVRMWRKMFEMYHWSRFLRMILFARRS